MSSVQGDKSEAILDAAYTIFGSKGFYETKMSDIADEAGIAKGTIYLYFKSKEQLFVAVSKRDCNEFISRLGRALEAHESTGDKLGAIAETHLTYYYERRNHTKLFFMAPNNDPDLMQFMKGFMREYMGVVREVLERAGVPDPVLLAEAYIGILDRLKMDIMLNPEFGEEDLNRRIAFAAALFLDGCRSFLQA
ncbi:MULTISPECIES: TetR/AcrR family transcriptional regulator [Paenibacillus]|uniref:TetR/AcrR family transcriptional regulator n=1 Tax=Paenibacillus TaxID=44249 RepID=UPI001F3EC4E4|nr:TetR/AcrR family transcriptional regulator [Paenibacillus sp. JJ-223]CAH1215223.1 Fatty acid metabolism regulator protein [Paenibacillus sp. JJ-223]